MSAPVIWSSYLPDVVREKILAIAPGATIYSSDDAVTSEVEVAFGYPSASDVAEMKSLRWIQLMGAGAERTIKLNPPEQIIITNASGIHAEPITEHMFGMVLSILRRLPVAWEAQQQGTWKSKELHADLGMLSGRTLGLLGVGAIGGHSARVGRAFGMHVIGLRRTGEPHPDTDEMLTPDKRDDLYSRCDVIMNTLPLTQQTLGFVDASAFAKMSPDTIFCNTGRGATVDTDALIDALESGQIAAACIDVTDPEPLPDGHRLWTTRNAWITPHYSGFHPGYMQRASTIFLDNLKRWVAGEPLQNVVDRELGY